MKTDEYQHLHKISVAKRYAQVAANWKNAVRLLAFTKKKLSFIKYILKASQFSLIFLSY
jgi:hypothetical protein